MTDFELFARLSHPTDDTVLTVGLWLTVSFRERLCGQLNAFPLLSKRWLWLSVLPLGHVHEPRAIQQFRQPLGHARESSRFCLSIS